LPRGLKDPAKWSPNSFQKGLAALIASEGELAMLLHLVVVKLMPASLTFSVRVGYTLVALLVLLTFEAFAGSSEQAQLLEALKLGNRGKFAQEVQVLGSLVHSDRAALDDANRGMAWNTLGTLHMLMGDNEQSRQCYENAIRLLRNLPGSSSAYASALANLGTLEISMNEFEAAEVSLRKAQEIDLKAADHVGLQEIALYRTNLAIARNNTRAAQRYLAEAFREADQAKGLSLRDRATMYSVAGSLAAKVKDFAAASSDYQQSIDLWGRACGAKCYYVGVESAFQADVYRELGEYSKAEDDIREALVLTEQAVGRNSTIYVAMEIIHARVLRAMGSKVEAVQQEADAKQRLDAMRHRQCYGCSVSAMGFR
jgi:tetratricopeptide (TPR) repeat protein